MPSFICGKFNKHQPSSVTSREVAEEEGKEALVADNEGERAEVAENEGEELQVADNEGKGEGHGAEEDGEEVELFPNFNEASQALNKACGGAVENGLPLYLFAEEPPAAVLQPAIASLRKAARAPCCAAAVTDDGISWIDANVTKQIDDSGLFEVSYLQNSVVAELGISDIYFPGDDAKRFAARRAAAVARRAESELQMQYGLFVDCMPMDDVAVLAADNISRMLESALNSRRLKEQTHELTALVSEVVADYSTAHNRMMLDALLRRPATAAAPPLPLSRAVQLPPLPVRRPPSRPADVPENNAEAFAEAFAEFSFATFLTRPEAVLCNVKIAVECARAAKLQLFSLNVTKALRVEEFEQLQKTTVDASAQHLREAWSVTLRHTVRSAFRDAGKGAFNLKEKDLDGYAVSKLRRFLTAALYRQEDSLRVLVMRSARQFVAFMERRLALPESIVSPSEVRPPPDAAAAAAAAEAGRAPPVLFQLDLSETPAGEFAYTVDPAAFQASAVALFDAALGKVAGIPQLASCVMDGLQWNPPPVIQTPRPDEAELAALREQLRAALAAAVGKANEYLALYSAYRPVLQFDAKAYIAAVESNEEMTLQEFKKEIDQHSAELARIVAALPAGVVAVGPFQVDASKALAALTAKKELVLEQLKGVLARRPSSICERVNAKFKELDRNVQAKPTDPEALKAQRELIQSIPKFCGEMMALLAEAAPFFDAMEDMRLTMQDTAIEAKTAAQFWPVRVRQTVAAVEDALAADEARYRTEQKEAQNDFERRLMDLAQAVATLQGNTDLSQIPATVQSVLQLDQSLKDADKEAATFNLREVLFGAPQTDYTRIKKLLEAFDPFLQFWVAAADLKRGQTAWMVTPLIELDAEQVEKDANTVLKVMSKMGKLFSQRGLTDCAVNCDKLRTDVTAFQEHVPLLLALRVAGMRDRHWERISAETSMEVNLKNKMSLEKAIEMGLPAHGELITKVSELASKEYAIETALDKIESGWKDAIIVVKEYRETGTFTINVDESITQQLDDHIVMLQAMSFSPFKKPFEERINEWEASLSLASETLDEWNALQKSWMYLEPIFSSPDIMQQLPLEAKRFAAVDRHWRKATQSAKSQPHLISACSSKRSLETFAECNRALDVVQKGLADYLETKRLAFARFFFLSNDELLQILSQAKNPLAVQPHLRKCFEAIDRLEFEPDQRIVAMKSGEGERVGFSEPMYPKGNVENWLGEVERVMRASTRQSYVDSLAAYAAGPRKDWVRNWPAMTVLAVGCTYWTRESEAAIEAGSLDAYYQQNVEQLNDLTDLVRGQLTNQERMTLGALIVIDVHARDVVQRLIDSKVASLADFDWVAQLRYYWETRGAEPQQDLFVKMVQATLAFGYEYLGNQPRLVVTPLTDRCYMTLMGAMHLNLGGAPAGPAGTGKTETTKDLAKALAKQCVVFNCSDGLDYLAMGKFLKGLASSGAWACFDEFNRIDLEVLSVVAQQILTIQIAIQQGLRRFTFEESEIKLDPCCTVFITMNPGYAGRSELPDNLKALFRPCAMMVPDYALIAEISLMSFGFRNGRPLSRKMVATFKLCSEQLSAQNWYDYGMRAVKSVITAAGNLKRDYPDEPEDVLLLRGLSDVNVPKFLAQDLPLFDGIISDLFPGVKKPDVDYGDLLGALDEQCVEMGIQNVEVFKMKVIQLYEMTVVRHGLMLVGPTGGGKTCCYRALAGAMTRLKKLGSTKYEAVKIVCLNPKSITMGQLYGDFDSVTHEWCDGVLPVYMRDLSAETTTIRKWLMFDGPVDAVWIENMNTVLDDNKKLCLVSGEIIQMSNTMTMQFEVEDLAVASPATVSRCGMIYMEPTSMGPGPVLTSWLGRLPAVVSSKQEEFQRLFDLLVPGLDGALFFLRRNLKEVVATVDPNLFASMFNVMDSLLLRYQRGEGEDPLTPAEAEAAVAAAVPLFLFSFIWSVGASCTGPGRPKMEEFLRAKAASNGFVEHMPPASKSMYEYCYDQSELCWKEWMDTVPPYKPNPDIPFSSIIVPTADTVRYTYLVDRLVAAGKHVLCVGETGTGKTLNIMDKLSNHMPADVQPIFITFSARTSANQTQDLLDSKMDKRRKGVFGPPAGKRFVVCVDDVNMPQREKYFAQPPIELLRQWMDHEGWYERRPPCTFRRIIDVQFVGCMGPPGGGRNPVTARFLRHFNFLAFADMSDESCARIFGTILGAALSRGFSAPITALTDKLTLATIEIYNTVRTDLLPTPAKSHYTFNLRDLARVFQGVLRADPKTAGAAESEMLALWLHENMRVFQDRMVSNEDRGWFRDLLDKKLGEHFSTSWQDVIGTDRIFFGDYLVPGADVKVYQRVTDFEVLQKLVEESLEDYNANSNAPMKLVLFLDALEHVSRVCRVIRLPLGNALLLGVGGSGRQSLTRLAAHLEEYTVFQIEVAKGYGVNEWREDLRKVLFKAGVEGRDVVFLFTDTQIVQESFLEDINNILNSGEVPNLWKTEHTEAIASAMRPILQALGQPITKMSMNAQFVERIRANLHCVLAMSPVGDVFRQRLRMFPSLVNCCTIDWFAEWPDSALKSVANTFLGDLKMIDDPLEGEEPDPNAPTREQLLSCVVDTCVFIHQSVERKSKRFYEELRRFNYVTPTSYLELLSTFSRLLGEKKEEISTQRTRLQIGLDKINSTAHQVAIMETELVELQPVLQRTQKEVDEMMIVIARDSEEAAETAKAVAAQEADANVKAASAKAIADDAQADLDKALPALDAAVQSLKNLTRNDVVEVKALKNPPAGVRLVMEACCIMFSKQPKMVNDDRPGAKPGAKMADYWEASGKLLADPTAFLDSLMNYDKDNIPEDVIKKIAPYQDREDFSVEAISKVSKACTSICMWSRAMYTYYLVSISIEPKRKLLNEAQSSLEVTMGILTQAKAKLAEVQAKLKLLDEQFKEATEKKEDLQKQVTRCTQQLDRAGKLIGGLGGERARWEETVIHLGHDLVNVVGDVTVASGVIAYSGPFTPVYRQQLSSEWMAQLKALGVPHTHNTSLTRTLADPVRIRAWAIAGLPSDAVSVENGIIVSKARRWPLMIDPQGQANRWIKNMEKEAGVDVIKLSDRDYLRTLANGIRFGRALLLENIGEALDAALEPLLLKQTFKQSGQEVIKMGDDVIPYHPDFRFYITTKLRNPHYQPEVSVKVSLLNFFVTRDGLEDQLLGTVVGQERADLAELKNQLVVKNAAMKKQLAEIEDKILFLLSNSTGNILDDEVLINTLAQSKITSNEIAAKVAEAERTEKTIDETRELYRPTAVRASILFFCISDLAAVDPMYQYSLSWFIKLFVRSITDADKAETVDERAVILNEHFTYSLYRNVCRSLFEAHKLMFSFLLCVAIAQNQGEIDSAEWRLLLAGPTDTSVTEPKPHEQWVTEKVWVELLNVAKLPAFKGLQKAFAANLDHYKTYFEAAEAHRHALDPSFDEKLTPFQRLLVLRCIRPDKVVLGVQDFVAQRIGQRFVEPPPFDLADCYLESSVTAPLIFVLSSGADPMADLLKLCEEQKMAKRFDQVSLGQGQGPKAERLLEQAMSQGMWVCLQNCHLAQSWMPKLEVIVENTDPAKVHKDFRLWLTSMPSPFFPASILQNGVKMTLEPPKGLKSNLVRSFTRLSDKALSESSKPNELRRLLFSICLFHAVIQDRRKFGPLGWNIRYEFTDGDLAVCQTQIRMLLEDYASIPFDVIRVLCGEVNYGGRVTDGTDRRLLNTLLGTFICEGAATSSEYSYSESGQYRSPACEDVAAFLEHIRGLPALPSPEIFGLHANADITCDQNETYGMFATVLSLQPRVAGGTGLSREEQIEVAAREIQDKCPAPFDIEIVQHHYPTAYEESMNTVLTQECIRYNGLLTVVRQTLAESLKALKGLVVMSPELESITNFIFDNRVPEKWADVAYPSLKPLSSWVVDLVERYAFIETWIRDGPPPVFWVSGFFFPQAFLTGTLQNYARRQQCPIDTVSFDFVVRDDISGSAKEGPESGCFIRGLYLEGAVWDPATHSLNESRPKELYTEFPVIWLKPTQHRVAPEEGIYMCPAYKTLLRAGTLSTTGHSTNFVMNVEVPSDKPQKHWIGRGVGLFCSLMF